MSKIMARNSGNISINMESNEMGAVNQNLSGNSESISLSTHVAGGIVNQYYSSSANCSRTEINNCLAPISSFTGREAELEKLTQLLEQHGTMVIVGMGGIGKTQLARQFASVHTDKYSNCSYWLKAQTSAMLTKSIQQLAGECNVRVNNNGLDRDIVTILKEIYKKIAEGKCLLILDNVEKRDDIYNCLPFRLGLANEKLHVLITSRRANWSRVNIPALSLGPLPELVALDLFKTVLGKSYEETPPEEWRKLAEILAYLPLALQVAASYIQQRRDINYKFTVVEYIKLLQKECDDLLEDPLIEYENKSIYKSIMMPLEELKIGTDRKSKLAVRLLNIAAYLNPDMMWKEHLIRFVDGMDKERKLDDALLTAIDYSLMNKHDDKYTGGYTMHRIIQKCILHNQRENETIDEYYPSALSYALSEWGHLEYVFQYADERAPTVAKYFAEHRSYKLLNYLVQYKCFVALKAIFGKQDKNDTRTLINEHNLLHSAVEGESVCMIELLCGYKPDMNSKDENNNTPLHVACHLGSIDIVECLLRNDAETGIADLEGRTALHKASVRANYELASVLLRYNRNLVDIANNCEQTSLHVIGDAEEQKDEDRLIATACVLLNYGALVLKTDKTGWSLLHHAAGCAYAKYVSFILRRAPELIHTVDLEGRTPFHVIGETDWDKNEDRIIKTAFEPVAWRLWMQGMHCIPLDILLIMIFKL